MVIPYLISYDLDINGLCRMYSSNIHHFLDGYGMLNVHLPASLGQCPLSTVAPPPPSSSAVFKCASVLLELRHITSAAEEKRWMGWGGGRTPKGHICATQHSVAPRGVPLAGHRPFHNTPKEKDENGGKISEIGRTVGEMVTQKKKKNVMRRRKRRRKSGGDGTRARGDKVTGQLEQLWDNISLSILMLYFYQ